VRSKIVISGGFMSMTAKNDEMEKSSHCKGVIADFVVKPASVSNALFGSGERKPVVQHQGDLD
jgi:hypothetical protein